MMIKKYNLINNVFGWLSFAIAAIVYLMTIEPTASFWDCGEFIASAYKLEVGHPPGAPFFMLTGKFFSLFASDPTQVAMMINAMSAILSALTILFLFWTITHLARKLIYTKGEEMTLDQMIIIIGSGLVGALAYTFTDTFWFSAVEGEVYAYSSMFTALVFWLILKWENRADEPGSDKWLVVIAYAMGLSIGVHLLNLLCIPAIVLVYYFKKHEKANVKGTLLALVASFVLIVVLMYGIIPGFTKVGGWFELFFVNSLGMSYNTGVLVYIVLLLAILAWGLYETLSAKGTLKRAKIAFVLCMVLSGITFIGDSILLWLVLIAAVIAGVMMYKEMSARIINTSILCLLVILIGYSSFALIPIRSIANTPMDQNSPENVFTLASYLNREQYGDRPLFYGKTYASDVVRDERGNPIKEGVKKSWDKVVKESPDEPDRYVVSMEVPSYKYDKTMLFPRMYSDEGRRHKPGYRAWAGITDFSQPPTMLQNLQFFFTYQLNHMYFRYFMWNFSGRENDIQGNGELAKGNWITGIKWFDEHILQRGPQDNLPPSIAENKGHNTFYALPFILGLLGIAFQLLRKEEGEKQFLVTFMLFFMTGIAIILYLNQQPQEPRERDYAYAGSFYAYCIWIGLGVAFVWNLLKKKLPSTVSAVIASVLCLFIPIQMASQTWDDHDRSGRYTMRDFGQNYLRALPENAILFTMGDNDTFPLWYAQEVEGFRTDVRVCNLSYLQTDWYVDQMRRDAYDSPALPITWEADRYSGMKGYAAYVFSSKDFRRIVDSQFQQEGQQAWMGGVNYSQYFDTNIFKESMPLDEAMDILKTKDNYAPRNPFDIKEGVILPASKFTTPVDTTKVDWATLGTTPQSDFVIDLGDGKQNIYRSEMMIMEMLNNIAKDDWKRPIYYALTIGEIPLNLYNQLMLEGINYRIVPGTIDPSRVNVDVMFDNLVNQYKWGGIENPDVYLDENSTRMARTFRILFKYLIDALIEKGDNERALIALDRCMEAIPATTVPRGNESISFVESYFKLGEKEKAEKVAQEILYQVSGSLQWYARLDPMGMHSVSYDIEEGMSTQLMISEMLLRYDSDLYRKVFTDTNNYLSSFMLNDIQFDPKSHPLVMNFRIAETALDKKMIGDSVALSADDEDVRLLKKAYEMTLEYEPRAIEFFSYKELIKKNN